MTVIDGIVLNEQAALSLARGYVPIHLPGTPYLISGETGHLFVDDCGLLDARDFRPSCTGHLDLHPYAYAAPRSHFWDKVAQIMSAIGKALITAFIPVLGKALGTFAEAMQGVLGTIQDLLKNIASFLFDNLGIDFRSVGIDWSQITAAFRDVSAAMYTTFSGADWGSVSSEVQRVYLPQVKSIATSVNGLVSGLRGINVESQYALSYVGIRESVAQILELRTQNPAAVVALIQQTVATSGSVRTLKEAVAADRVRGNIVQIAHTLPMFRGISDRAIRSALETQMPDPKSFADPQVLMSELARRPPGADLAQSFVSKYAGDRPALLEDWKRLDVAPLAPDALKQDLADAFDATKRFDEVIDLSRNRALDLWRNVETDLTAIWADRYRTDPVVPDDAYRFIGEWDVIAADSAGVSDGIVDPFTAIPTLSVIPPFELMACAGSTMTGVWPVRQGYKAKCLADTLRAHYVNPQRLRRFQDVYDEEHRRRTDLRTTTDQLIQDAVESAKPAVRRGRLEVIARRTNDATTAHDDTAIGVSINLAVLTIEVNSEYQTYASYLTPAAQAAVRRLVPGLSDPGIDRPSYDALLAALLPGPSRVPPSHRSRSRRRAAPLPKSRPVHAVHGDPMLTPQEAHRLHLHYIALTKSGIHKGLDPWFVYFWNDYLKKGGDPRRMGRIDFLVTAEAAKIFPGLRQGNVLSIDAARLRAPVKHAVRGTADLPPALPPTQGGNTEARVVVGAIFGVFLWRYFQER